MVGVSHQVSVVLQPLSPVRIEYSYKSGGKPITLIKQDPLCMTRKAVSKLQLHQDSKEMNQPTLPVVPVLDGLFNTNGLPVVFRSVLGLGSYKTNDVCLGIISASQIKKA